LGNLLAGEALIYERSDDVVYAHYRDAPHNKIPRWVVGGKPGAVARANGAFLSCAEWNDLCDLSLTNTTLRTLLTKLVATYMLTKEDT